MKKYFIPIIIVIIGFWSFVVSSAIAGHVHPEKYYQEKWCNEHNGIIEYILDDGTRVDCLTDTHAIEFDFAPKWAEAIGQSLYYSSQTEKEPGIVLIMDGKKDIKYLLRIWTTMLYHGFSIRTWSMQEDDSE